MICFVSPRTIIRQSTTCTIMLTILIQDQPSLSTELATNFVTIRPIPQQSVSLLTASLRDRICMKLATYYLLRTRIYLIEDL